MSLSRPVYSQECPFGRLGVPVMPLHPEPAESEPYRIEPSPDATAAFEAAVRMHYVRLSRFAFRMVKSWDVAEDAVQEALFKCWRRRASINARDPLPYLYQAVRNECLMILRRERPSVDPDQVKLSDPRRLADEHQAQDLQAAVDRAIDALPERCRAVFTMSREQELTYAEIARLLNISVKTVETQMGRALKALRRALASHLGAVVLALAGGANSLFR